MIIRLPFIILFFLFCGYNAFAQPANDNPCNATPLSVTANCNYVNSTTVGATNTPLPDPGCALYFGMDVWFSAIVPSSGFLHIDGIQGTMTDG